MYFNLTYDFYMVFRCIIVWIYVCFDVYSFWIEISIYRFSALFSALTAVNPVQLILTNSILFQSCCFSSLIYFNLDWHLLSILPITVPDQTIDILKCKQKQNKIKIRKVRQVKWKKTTTRSTSDFKMTVNLIGPKEEKMEKSVFWSVSSDKILQIVKKVHPWVLRFH